MSKESYFGLALGLLSIALAGVQGMYPIIPPIIGWPIVSLSGAGAIILLIVGARKKEHLKNIEIADKPYAEQWEHYKKLTDLFISLKEVSETQRGEVLNNISRERIYLDDNELQEWIDLFLNAEAEGVRFGIKADDHMVRRVLDMTKKRMDRKYKR